MHKTRQINSKQVATLTMVVVNLVLQRSLVGSSRICLYDIQVFVFGKD
jgi:hypothetical protein